MGIYSNGSIFGIQIYNLNDDVIDILFLKKYDEMMNSHQMREAYLSYTNLNDKNNILFEIYTECSWTYDVDTFMAWYPITLEIFLEKFNI